MHRQLTLILALSLLFTVVLPIHVLAGGIDNHLSVARSHRMLKKRADNPLAALLGAPGSQASAGDGGAANVAPPPTAQSQNGNTAGSTNTNDGSGSSPTTGSGQTNGGTTTSDSGAGSGAGTDTGTGAQDGGNTPASGNSNTGTTNSNGNADTNQSGNNAQGGSPVGSILTGLLGSPKATSSAKVGDTANNSTNSTSSTATSTSTTTSTSSTPSLTPSSPSSTPSVTPTLTPTSSSNDVTTMTSITFESTPTVPPTDDDSNTSSSTTITRNTIIILVAIGASVGVAAIVWTVIRKWKFRPSSNFDSRMQPINWEPSPHDDDGGIIAEKLNRNPSTRSHGSFTSGTGHAGANDGLVSDLPPLDAMGGPGHLAPVGGYANLQRGPSPQPMYELPNPHHYPVPQQQYYNPGQGSAYGY
ncbi:hypothetical protein Clacol_004124 [Clathrus columnatus]|uniref:Uncharacterized protein n=1 Tax=Clathrus columnatus TaxID=1419009 RepID=A0AAV5A6I3_9AGAM|nr:hypothetical protein Clacol_004124 [Clathrus columnatus]